MVIDTDRGIVVENYRHVQAITMEEKQMHQYLPGINRVIVKGNIVVRKSSREKVDTILKKYSHSSSSRRNNIEENCTATWGVRKWVQQGYRSPLAKKVDQVVKKYLTNRI